MVTMSKKKIQKLSRQNFEAAISEQAVESTRKKAKVEAINTAAECLERSSASTAAVLPDIVKHQISEHIGKAPEYKHFSREALDNSLEAETKKDAAECKEKLDDIINKIVESLCIGPITKGAADGRQEVCIMIGRGRASDLRRGKYLPMYTVRSRFTDNSTWEAQYLIHYKTDKTDTIPDYKGFTRQGMVESLWDGVVSKLKQLGFGVTEIEDESEDEDEENPDRAPRDPLGISVYYLNRMNISWGKIEGRHRKIDYS